MEMGLCPWGGARVLLKMDRTLPVRGRKSPLSVVEVGFKLAPRAGRGNEGGARDLRGSL